MPTNSQELELYLNSENRTLDPSIEIPLDKLLNITIKYSDYLGVPISRATVTLLGEGVIKNLNESVSLNQYSTIINTTLNLKNGINLFTIEAEKVNHQEKSLNTRFIVRKIN